MREKMKPRKAYAIVEGDRLAIFDYRLPICWKMKLAKRDAEEFCGGDARIVRVIITEDKP